MGGRSLQSHRSIGAIRTALGGQRRVPKESWGLLHRAFAEAEDLLGLERPQKHRSDPGQMGL